jgi:hypothetical protein
MKHAAETTLRIFYDFSTHFLFRHDETSELRNCHHESRDTELLVAMITLATFVQLSASAQSTAEKTLYSQKEVAQLTREAHTPEQ